MRDKGLDKGLIKEFNDSDRGKRGWSEGFFGFRKMFRDYLTKLKVAFFDECCPDLTGSIYPLRYNDGTGNIERFNGIAWVTVEGGTFVSDSITLDNGTAAAPAVRLGADTNDGLYGDTDGIVAISAEGTKVAVFTSDGIGADGFSSLSGAFIAGLYPQAAAQQNILAGAGGAISITAYLTTINTDAGGDAFTLANGTVRGHRKKIRLVTDGGGDGVVTVATPMAGGSTITFNDAGDYVDLIWSGTAWTVLENSGTTIA